MTRQINRARSIPLEYGDDFRRGQGGGDRPPGLWEQFERVVSDLTHGMRRAARQRLVAHRLHLEEQISRTADAQAAATLRARESALGRDFTMVVNGGLAGAGKAVAVFLTLDPIPKNSGPA